MKALATPNPASLLIIAVLACVVGCDSAITEDTSPASTGTQATRNQKEKMRVRFDRYDVGSADAATVSYQIAIVNYGSADGPGTPNTQYARNEAILKEADLQDFFAANQVVLFYDQESHFPAPRGLNVDDYNDGDNKATLALYSARKAYKPTVISPPTKEQIIKEVSSLKEWLDYNRPKSTK